VAKTKGKNLIAIALAELSCDAIESKPVNIDWRETLGEDCEGWRSFEANECEECRGIVVLSCNDGGEAHSDCPGVEAPEECEKCGGTLRAATIGDAEDEDDRIAALECEDCGHKFVDPEHCNGHVGTAEGPMMNYWYPVKIEDCAEAARKLAHLPLCVVEMRDGETGLALTGGGMDLSWEICAAFITLGYLPPFHFCDVPAMAGKTLNDGELLVLAACKRTCEVIGGWAASRIDRLKATEKSIRKYNRERAAERQPTGGK
jgi:hypothetical protein